VFVPFADVSAVTVKGLATLGILNALLVEGSFSLDPPAETELELAVLGLFFGGSVVSSSALFREFLATLPPPVLPEHMTAIVSVII